LIPQNTCIDNIIIHIILDELVLRIYKNMYELIIIEYQESGHVLNQEVFI